MELQVRKATMPKVCEYTVRDFFNFSVPSFIYGNLICLKLNGKFGCICKKTGKLLIAFNYDKITVAKNGIVKAYYEAIDGSPNMDFYDSTGQKVAKYCYIEGAKEHEEYYIHEDEIDLSVITYEDHDEETYSYSCMSRHILADGTVKEIWGRDLDEADKKVGEYVKHNVMYPFDFQNVDSSDYEKFKKNVTAAFENQCFNIDVLPFEDPDWVMIDDKIYYRAEGMLRVYDVSEVKMLNLFENDIEIVRLGNKIYSTGYFLSHVEDKKNYNLVFEKDHLVAVKDSMCAVELKFGNATRHKFFVSEKAAEAYISNFEEEILDKILKK